MSEPWEVGQPSLNRVDLSGYVSDGWGTSDIGQGWTVQPGNAGDYETCWHEKLSGLQRSSITVTGEWSSDLPSLANIFTEHFPERDIIIQQPDGRWQAVKARLARWRPLRWLKVRWRVYSTRAVAHIDQETGVLTFEATAPVIVTTVTRRGGR